MVMVPFCLHSCSPGTPLNIQAVILHHNGDYILPNHYPPFIHHSHLSRTNKKHDHILLTQKTPTAKIDKLALATIESNSLINF